MLHNEIKIQDILIQGKKGQRLDAFIHSSLDPQSCSREELYQTFGYQNQIIRFENQFFLVNPTAVPLKM